MQDSKDNKQISDEVANIFKPKEYDGVANVMEEPGHVVFHFGEEEEYEVEEVSGVKFHFDVTESNISEFVKISYSVDEK